MKSNHPQEKINKLLDNELSEEERSQLLRHIKQCKKCGEKYRASLFLKELLSQKDKAEPSDYFMPKLLNRLRSAEFALPTLELIAKRAWSLILGFSCIILLTLGIFIYTSVKASAEVSFRQSYEDLILTENSEMAPQASSAQLYYDYLWQSMVEE